MSTSVVLSEIIMNIEQSKLLFISQIDTIAFYIGQPTY